MMAQIQEYVNYFMLRLVVRRCPYCGSSTVRRSRRQNLFEAIALPLLLLRPYRCQACDLRHYSFVFTKRGQSASMQGNRD